MEATNNDYINGDLYLIGDFDSRKLNSDTDKELHITGDVHLNHPGNKRNAVVMYADQIHNKYHKVVYHSFMKQLITS